MKNSIEVIMSRDKAEEIAKHLTDPDSTYTVIVHPNGEVIIEVADADPNLVVMTVQFDDE